MSIDEKVNDTGVFRKFGRAVKEKVDQYLPRQMVPHPNRISAVGAALSIGSVPLAIIPYTCAAAPFVYAAGAILDAIDGKVARSYDMKTKEGGIIDPFMDKTKNLAVGGLIIAQNLSNPFLVGSNLANFTVDYISQKKRGPILEQTKNMYQWISDPSTCTPDHSIKSAVRAHIAGKVKTVLQNTSHFVYLTNICFGSKIASMCNFNYEQFTDNVNLGIAMTLGISAISGGYGLYKRMQNK